MDIDISDILADVSKPPNQQTQQSSSLSTYDLSTSATSSYTDHQLLVRAWTSERCSPTLLPYPSQLISRTMTRIQTQITRIEDMSSGVDLGTSTAGPPGGGGGQIQPKNTNLILSILQTDLSRTQFILRSYLRQRLSKITTNAVYYLKFHEKHQHHNAEEAEENDEEEGEQGERLLSRTELKFLSSHQALLSEFYDNSFLNSFPESRNLRRLDDTSGASVSMVEPPDGSGAVVVRCLAERWDNEREVLEAPDGTKTVEDGIQPDVELRFARGEIWVVRWRDVRAGVVTGDLELL